MALIMPNGGRTANWGVPGAQQQMPITRGPEQLAWQQQNQTAPAAKPSGNFSSYRPGQAQSQQSPYSSATPYGQPKPQNQPDNPWNQGGTNQQQTRQPDLTQYMSPGNPLGRSQQTQAAPPMAGQQMPSIDGFPAGRIPPMISFAPGTPDSYRQQAYDNARQQAWNTQQSPQFGQSLPFGGQNAGIPPFQFRATDFMGNQFADPGAFTAQQGAMAQALNQQRAQGIGQGQFGPLNPQLAYQQGAEMLQGGWQNPFASSEDQIRRLAAPPGPAPAGGGMQTQGGSLSDPRWSHNGGQWRSPLGPGQGGGGINQSATWPPGAMQPGGPTERPRMPTYSVPPDDRPILMAPGSPGDRERPPVTPGTAQPIPPQESPPSADPAPQQNPAVRKNSTNAYTKADAPPGQRFDNVAYEAELRSLRDEVAANTRAGRTRGREAKTKQRLDWLRENRDYLRAQAEDSTAGMAAALQAIDKKRRAADAARSATSAAPAGAAQSGDKIVNGFNYSAAQRDYRDRHRTSVQSQANQRFLGGLSPANNSVYGLMQRY